MGNNFNNRQSTSKRQRVPLTFVHSYDFNQTKIWKYHGERSPSREQVIGAV